jgi:hypothetical protein
VKPQFLGHHPSSKDPHNTSQAAHELFDEFLDVIRDNNDTSTSCETNPSGTQRKPGAVYLRSICRLYLMDFICADYALPEACGGILLDMDNSLAEYNEKAICEATGADGTLSKLISRRSLRRLVLEVLAFVRCFFARSPECRIRLIYGDEELEGD